MATALEYGLIAALISVGIITTATALGGNSEKEPECSDALRYEFKQAVNHSYTLMTIKGGNVQLELEDGSTCNMRLNY